jgi:hypothetical protein
MLASEIIVCGGKGGLLQHDGTTNRVFVNRGLLSKLYYRCLCKMFHSLRLKSCIISENTKERGVLNRSVKYCGVSRSRAPSVVLNTEQ